MSQELLIAVVGAGKCDEETRARAEEVGRRLARRGATVVCGGLGGVMQAACQGAKSVGGRTIGILPGSDVKDANPFVDIAIVTGLGELRNALVVRTCRSVVAIGGEFGTLSEIAFALKFGIPVIGLDTWQLARSGRLLDEVIRAKDAEEAVEMALARAQSH